MLCSWLNNFCLWFTSWPLILLTMHLLCWPNVVGQTKNNTIITNVEQKMSCSWWTCLFMIHCFPFDFADSASSVLTIYGGQATEKQHNYSWTKHVHGLTFFVCIHFLTFDFANNASSVLTKSGRVKEKQQFFLKRPETNKKTRNKQKIRNKQKDQEQTEKMKKRRETRVRAEANKRWSSPPVLHCWKQTTITKNKKSNKKQQKDKRK